MKCWLKFGRKPEFCWAASGDVFGQPFFVQPQMAFISWTWVWSGWPTTAYPERGYRREPTAASNPVRGVVFPSHLDRCGVGRRGEGRRLRPTPCSWGSFSPFAETAAGSRSDFEQYSPSERQGVGEGELDGELDPWIVVVAVFFLFGKGRVELGIRNCFGKLKSSFFLCSKKFFLLINIRGLIETTVKKDTFFLVCVKSKKISLVQQT